MKRKLLTGTIIILILICMVIFYNYYQYIIMWGVNPHISVDGVKLMMPEDEVRQILGEPEENIPGFGGYYFAYKSKGINLTFLNDSGTDFYKKVNAIEVYRPGYYIYDVQVGQEYDKAMAKLREYGIRGVKEGYPGVWKNNMLITIDKDTSGRVVKISIKYMDRVSSKRIY